MTRGFALARSLVCFVETQLSVREARQQASVSHSAAWEVWTSDPCRRKRHPHRGACILLGLHSPERRRRSVLSEHSHFDRGGSRPPGRSKCEGGARDPSVADCFRKHDHRLKGSIADHFWLRGGLYAPSTNATTNLPTAACRICFRRWLPRLLLSIDERLAVFSGLAIQKIFSSGRSVRLRSP